MQTELLNLMPVNMPKKDLYFKSIQEFCFGFCCFGTKLMVNFNTTKKHF